MATINYEKEHHIFKCNEGYENLKKLLDENSFLTPLFSIPIGRMKDGKIVIDKPKKEKKPKDPVIKVDSELKETFYYASAKLREMESTIDEQNKQIAEYQKFFNTLKSFLPKDYSSRNTIYG